MKENKKDLSIEYAHIYTNNKISEEHQLSLKVLGKLKEEMTAKNKTFSLVVMIDDYSFPDPSFNYNEFSLWLKNQGFSPDILFRESQLIPLCDEVLNCMENQKLKSQLIDYIKVKKYPCSLFIAAWYLLRLGYLEHKYFNKSLYANHLLNILPVSFKPFEDKGLEIIGSTTFKDAEKHIEYNFIEGRIIA